MKANLPELQNTNWPKIYKQILVLAIPILIAHVVEASTPFLNVYFAAQLGEIALAASSLVTSAFLGVMGLCWGIIAAVGIIAAKRIGEKKTPHEVGLVLWAGFAASIVLSVPVMFVFKYMSVLWHWAGQDPKVTQQGQAYLDGLMFFVPADLIKFSIFQFAIACNRPTIPLIGNILGVPLLVLMNLLLIPYFGIYGIGLASAGTYWVLAMGMFIYLYHSSYFSQYLKYKFPWKEGLAMLKRLFYLGVPIGLMFSIELLFFMVVTLMMGYFGTTALASNQIIMQWLGLILMLAFGFAEAITILVAKAHGSKDYRLVNRITFAGVVLSFFTMVLAGMLYWFAPDLAIRINLEKTAENLPIFELTATLFALCGVYQIVDGVRIVVSGALRGLECSQSPMWITAFGFWCVSLPICYLLAFSMGFKASGLWGGLIFGTLVGAIIQYIYLFYKVGKLNPSPSIS